MPIRANIDKRFLSRLGLTGLAFVALALWFFYDGAITYPRQRERALEDQRLKEEDRLDEWGEIAKQRGWSTEDPGKPKEDVDFLIQFIIGGVVSLPGLYFLISYLRARGRWIEADEAGLRASWGQQLEFGQIVSLDKKKWNSKGIAKVNYRQNGRKRRLVLDDWKYEADPTREILLEVESHIDDDQIIGGAPEPLPEEEEEVGEDEMEQEDVGDEEPGSAPEEEPR